MRSSPTYSDAEAAALYDVLNRWGASDDFYLRLVLGVTSVLDVGCGTGTLLSRAREVGHAGRLCGVDPNEARLNLARRRADAEWISGTAASMRFDREFELAVMTGHAFQELLTDEEIRESLGAISWALGAGGRFAFDTRNPEARAWEAWTPENAMDVVDQSGSELRVSHDVQEVAGDVVTLTETTSDRAGTALRIDRASLRFVGADALRAFLTDAGFSIEAEYGGWQHEPFDGTSPEIVTVARVEAR